MNKFKCECGKEFNNPQSFNGHKSHCKIHWDYKYGEKGADMLHAYHKNITKVALEIARITNIECSKEKEHSKSEEWIKSGPHYCEKCGKELPKCLKDVFGSGRFCSRSCANSRICSDKTKHKISSTLKEGYNLDLYKVHKLTEEEYYKEFRICIDCGQPIEFERRYSKICNKCSKVRCHDRNVKAGKSSAAKQSELRRSKNEIYFCELCENYFNNVRHNEPIFNGWDADIIIDDIKYAILWNGKWHYSKITKNHSVKQVQNRDSIKINEIVNCGYTPYVIKDMGKYNKDFVEHEFNLFINSLNVN